MSSFFASNADEVMGSTEERESQISAIISYLGFSTIGELVWVQRFLERNFKDKNIESDDKEANIYEKKKQEVEKLLTDYNSMISRIANLQGEKESVQETVENLKTDISNLTSEKEEIKDERDSLARELERVGKLYKEVTGKQGSEKELRGVLDIYITLIEEIFSGRAHFKVLSIIHGEKESWSRVELVKSTGISEIQLRTVLGELARAKMIDYDEEKAKIKLVKRLSAF